MPLFAKHPRTFIQELPKHIGKEVSIAGWISTKRDHGKVLFLDIRDNTGKIQTVATASLPFFADAQQAKEQSSVIVSGTVTERPERLRTDEPNGAIELQLTDVTVVTSSRELPWGDTPTSEVSEELRMRYRYLDIREGQIMTNLKLRSRVNQFIRTYLSEHGFTEVETPYITKGTPEGAREYLVPSRLHPGKFYALPQSPQQFKQLLMVAGLDRYYQIVRCFRDEDTRGDRQPEFTQLDIEMSYVTQEDIIDLIEPMLIAMVKELTPEKHITQVPFPRISYAEAMEQYGTDRPDLRKDKNDPNELAFCWVLDWPLFERSESENKLVAMHHLFTSPRKGDEALLDTQPEAVMGLMHDVVLNGYEVAGGSIRIHDPEVQKKVFQVLGISDKEAQEKFGHMLEAFTYGAPPHGGIASGLDRLVAVLAGAPNIREVIAFPKTGDGRDLLMEAPSPASEAQLRELHIRVDESKK